MEPGDGRAGITRRRFLTAGAAGAAGLALYSGEIARHWLEVTNLDLRIPGLPSVFDGMRIAQISDIHLEDFTEPFFLRHVVNRVNQMRPDAVFLTGDYVSGGVMHWKAAVKAAWHCAEILSELHCRPLYAVLGNHDVAVGEKYVIDALTARGITMLNNSYLPIERTGGRFWLAGIDDPVWGHPDPDRAIPPAIRNHPNEPIVLLCHAPDYADELLQRPAGQAIRIMLSGHTHGGQVRLPVLGALQLPTMGRKYVEGLFRFGATQLYVNRGIGTIGVPFRLNCPPELTQFTLQSIPVPA